MSKNGNNDNGNGDYDYGKNRTADLRDPKIHSYTFTSKSGMGGKLVPSGYADNAMADPSMVNEADEDSQIEQLHHFVKGVLSDKKIIAGASLKPLGAQKVAAHLGISAKEVMGLMASLRAKLRNAASPSRLAIAESQNPRYSYEEDGMLNVTIRDRETGDEFYFGSSQGGPLIRQLKGLDHGSPDEQALLASYVDQDTHEMVRESDDKADFLSEIASPVTTFNFPWKFEGDIGTATAQCRMDGKNFVIEVVDCRDSDGEEIAIDDDLEEALKDQAEDFIPEA